MLRFSALLLVWLTVAGVVFSQSGTAMGEIRQPATVVVTHGDTLWKLAKTHAPRGMDIRDYLDEILKANQLPNAIVHPGQQLILP